MRISIRSRVYTAVVAEGHTQMLVTRALAGH